MKKTRTESKISPEVSSGSAVAAPVAPAPRKRAVKTPVSKVESPPVKAAEAFPSPEAPAVSLPAAPAAAVTEKPAAVPAVRAGIREMIPDPAEPSPAPVKAAARKTAARKTARKTAAADKTAPEPAPEPPVLVLQVDEAAPAPVPAAKAGLKTPRKVPAVKKTARVSKEDTAAAVTAVETAAPAAEPARTPAPAPSPEPALAAPEAAPAPAFQAAPEPPAAASRLSPAAGPLPDGAAPAAKSGRPPRGSKAPAAQRSAPRISGTESGPQAAPASASSPEDPSAAPVAGNSADPPAARARENAEPQPDRGGERGDFPARPPRGERDPEGRAPHPAGPSGPEGEGRRLTKFERWKLRKEKFKLQKQQRYLERTGRAPQGPGAPGSNGQGGQGQGPAGGAAEPPPGQDRREPRELRERDPRERDPRDRDPRDQREPRVWEPRPPRPEPVLGPPEDCEGLLELTDNKGFGFLRPRDRGFSASPQDPFVSAELVRQLGLRDGVYVDAVMRRGGRGPMVQEIRKVNGEEPNAYRTLPLFEELTAVNPSKRYILETEASRSTTRLIDFISPIGRGQRGLIVAPPRAGKTTFLQHIAEAVLRKYEDVKVIVLLVDERPEEVTELSRALPGAEIMASSNDQDPRNHIRMAHLAIERAKRLVEAGRHVFMLLDSITRLARSFNNAIRGGGGGKAMSGGLDSRALEAPRRLFAAARNTREAGSLTIMATALVETNNKGDDLIFQEFKGTGNMELVLDRKISQQYIYPAVDIFKSGTRREELLLPAHQLEKVHLIRRGLSGHRPAEAVERLLQVMSKYPSNNQMLVEIKSRE